MELSLTQGLMMGLVSGLTELLPVSAEAHRGLLRNFFGASSDAPLLTLLCHAAVLFVLMMSAQLELPRLLRTRKQLRLPPKRRTYHPELNSINTMKLLRSAAVVTAAGTLLGTYLEAYADRLYLLAAALTLGGVLLWLPGNYRTGNKDARNLVPADGMILGAAAALGAVPGLSAVGLCMSAASVRGVDRRYALRFAWLLLIVRLSVLMLVDILHLIALGAAIGWMEILYGLAVAAAAALGAWLGVRLMRAVVKSTAITGFAFYNWGMALLCLTTYLLVS